MVVSSVDDVQLVLFCVQVNLVEESHPVFDIKHVVCQQLWYFPCDLVSKRVRSLSYSHLSDLVIDMCRIGVDRRIYSSIFIALYLPLLFESMLMIKHIRKHIFE